MPSELSISDIQDFNQILDSFAGVAHVYYRGQREDWPLLPSIARINPRSSILDDEKKMFLEFRRRAPQFIDVTPSNPWDWLAIAQYYGLPTRLLDWTRDPFAGLWFAVRTPAVNSCRAAVLWIFTPEPQDIVEDLSKRRPFSGTRTKVFIPSTKLLDRRIKAQKGAFTVHKYLTDKKRFIPLQKNRQYKSRLSKVIIQPNLFPILRRHLHDKEIDDSYLFPDLDGLSRTIAYKYCKSWDEP